MSLAHAILGFLAEASMTGYDLKVGCFDGSVAHFWPADQAQIYRTLDKLAAEGFVESHTEFQEDRPNRKIYKITEAGRGELRHWLSSPQPLPVHREPFLIDLFFADQLSNEVILKLLEGQLAAHQERLATYQAIGLPPPHAAGLPRALALKSLTLDMGLRTERTTIEWLQYAIEVVRGLRS